MDTILDKVKLALRITTTAFDDELTDLINACLLDLGIAGVEIPYTQTVDTQGHEISVLDNDLVIMAIKTYCKIHFGDAKGVEEIDRLKMSYDEQKAQMSMATGYTVWD